MKTALELLGDLVNAFDFCDDKDCEFCPDKRRGLELVAKRAREEAYELAAQHVETRIGSRCEWTADHALRHVADNIRALPVEARP